jgi:hypothetical protein
MVMLGAVSVPLVATDVVPVPPTASIFAENAVVDAPPDAVKRPEKVSADVVALFGKRYENPDLLLNVLQSLDERQPACDPDAVWQPREPPLPTTVKEPVNGEDAVSVEVAAE